MGKEVAMKYKPSKETLQEKLEWSEAVLKGNEHILSLSSNEEIACYMAEEYLTKYDDICGISDLTLEQCREILIHLYHILHGANLHHICFESHQQEREKYLVKEFNTKKKRAQKEIKELKKEIEKTRKQLEKMG